MLHQTAFQFFKNQCLKFCFFSSELGDQPLRNKQQLAFPIKPEVYTDTFSIR